MNTKVGQLCSKRMSLSSSQIQN